MNQSDLEQLRARLRRADESLRKLASEYADKASRQGENIDVFNYWSQHDRLMAKAEGVRLAISYVEEMLREY